MAIDTKPNFNSGKFEQCVGDIMNLSGCTQIYGKFDMESGSTLTICNNLGAGKVLTSDASGIGTWQSPIVTSVDNGLNIISNVIELGGTLIKNTEIDTSTHNLTISNLPVRTTETDIIYISNGGVLATGVASDLGLVNLYTYSAITGNQSIGILPSGDTLGMVYIKNDGTAIAYVDLGTTTTGNEITPFQPIEVYPNEDVSVTVNMRLSETENVTMYINSTGWTSVDLTLQWANISYKNVVPSGGGGITWNGSTANGVATYDNVGSICSESNLTFDGTKLLIGTTPICNNIYSQVIIGVNAGLSATGATDSNFIGGRAGGYATDSCNSNFVGYAAGENSTFSRWTNFIGNTAGRNSINTSSSNFIGSSAGTGAEDYIYANVIGFESGYYSCCVISSSMIGHAAGMGADFITNSNFIGCGAGNTVKNITNSNFIGFNSGNRADGACESNFIGVNAGCCATGSTYSNFIGVNAGTDGKNVELSNFLGFYAGNGATDACSSNFIGAQAGNGATGACESTFIGSYAGAGATSANYSNFIGRNAGVGAINATNSNFIGVNAGDGAINGTNSNFIGRNVGACFTGNNVGSNNIIIGTNVSLPNACANMINLGGVLFGTGTYSTTTGNPLIIGNSGGRIGILTNAPGGQLSLGNSVVATTTANQAQFYVISGEMWVKDGGGTATQISPHATDAPEWMYDDEIMPPQISKEMNDFDGIVRYTNNTRKDKLIEMQINGEELPIGNKRKFIFTETYVEHNLRTGDSLVIDDWDEYQEREHLKTLNHLNKHEKEVRKHKKK